MGSHYIPVGKLKIDKDFLDIACPAAGFDRTPPLPEIYCPLHGYYPEESYTPDQNWFPTPDANNEEIILLCSDELDAMIRFLIYVNTGVFAWEIYGDNGALLDSGTSASTTAFVYEFTMGAGYPHPDGYSTFMVKFKSVEGNHFTRFERTTLYKYALTGWPVLEVKLNTPNLTTFTLQAQKQLRYCWMCSQMNSLVNTTTSIYYAFQYTHKLESVVLPEEMNSLVAMNNWFQESVVPKVTLPVSLPECQTIAQIFMNAQTKKVDWPTYLPKITNINAIVYGSYVENINLPEMPLLINTTMLARDAKKLKHFTAHHEYPSATTGYWELSNVFNLEGEITFPARPLNNNQTFILYYARKVTKFTILGTADTVTDSRCVSYCDSLLELTLPTSMNGLKSPPYISNCPALKKLNYPLSLAGLTDASLFSNISFSNSPNIEEINTCNNWGTNSFELVMAYFPQKVKIWNQPNLRLAHISSTIYSSSARALEYFEIDWNYVTGNLIFKYCNFSASELNRIFTALPDSGTGQTIDVTANPGVATCDPSIATAKGWTVMGA